MKLRLIFTKAVQTGEDTFSQRFKTIDIEATEEVEKAADEMTIHGVEILPEMRDAL